MSREVRWGRRARREFQTIADRDAQTGARIEAAIEAYADRDHGDVRKMAGGSGIYRLCAGDWRVLFTLDDGGRIMAIARVPNRRDAYRD